MKEESDKTGYVRFSPELRIKNINKKLTLKQIKELEKIFGGLIRELDSYNEEYFSLEYLIENHALFLDIGGFDEDNHYLFSFSDFRSGFLILRYFLLNAEFDCGCFYVYGGREVYPAIDYKTGVLSFSAKNLEEINKKRRSWP